MIKRILIPTDFSSCANNAMRFGGEIAWLHKAEVTLLHIHTIPVVDPVVPTGTLDSMIREMENASRANLKKAQAKMGALFPNLTITTKSKSGFPVLGIIDFAKKGKFDLIVMGTTGASGMEELLVGSNTASILEKAHCPVMAIPERAKYAPVKSILYTTDLSMPEAKTFKVLIEFAKAFGASIRVLHVQNEMDRYFKMGNIRFDNYGKMAGYNKITYDELKSEKVFDSINRYINKHDFGMVAMATHSRGFFDKLFHRSLTKRMAYHSKIPLLSFKKD